MVASLTTAAPATPGRGVGEALWLTMGGGLDNRNGYALVGEDRATVEVKGPDATEYLQGLITNHMPRISDKGGRVMFDAFIYNQTTGREDPRYLIEVNQRVKDKLMMMLRFYKLRSRVHIRDATEEYGVWNIWGEMGGKEDRVGWKAWQQDSRAPNMGIRALLEKGSKPRFESSEFVEAASDKYKLRRILEGVAEGPDDFVPDVALPLECNLDYMGGVDFNKGCYVGQELTIRSHHRGVVRKRMVPVIMSGERHAGVDLVDLDAKLGVRPQMEVIWNPGPATTSDQGEERRRRK
ncbi:ccr4 associated factor, partial [Spiromyces aspiralis]